MPTAGATLTDVELLGWAALDKMDKGFSQGSDIRTTPVSYTHLDVYKRQGRTGISHSHAK